METSMIDGKALEKQLGELLDIFYSKRKDTLQNLKLIPTLKRKNPYLYRATGVATGSEIIQQVMAAHFASGSKNSFPKIVSSELLMKAIIV